MAIYSNYRLLIRDATPLADLAGIEQDLSAVVSYCGFLLENTEVAKRYPVLVGAVLAAAVVRYARCFVTGKRDRLKKALFDGNEELQQAHNYFIDLRNKHIVHPVNLLEKNAVTVKIGDHFTSAQEINSLGTTHIREIVPSHNELIKLKRLAEIVLEIVKALKREEAKRLMKLVQAQSLRELKRGGLPSIGKS